MNMKKSLIATAVAGALTVPATASAAEAYGTLNINLQTASFDDAGAPSAGYFFNAPSSEDSGITMADGLESRWGFRGSEDLGNGLTANYRWEFGSAAVGANNEGAPVDTRLSWIGLSGDFGEVKLGTMWSTLFVYSGWNIWRTNSNGSFVYNYMTSPLGDNSGGLRVDNTVQYTYGAGGYGSDPFTFTLEGGFQDNGAADEETLDHIAAGAQGTFGDIKVNGMVYSESNTTGNEPTFTSIGGEWNPGPYWLGASFMTHDADNPGGTDLTGFQITGGMDFGGGLSGIASFGTAEDDGATIADVDSQVFLHLGQELSSRTSLYADVEAVTMSDDTGATVFTVGMDHSF